MAANNSDKNIGNSRLDNSVGMDTTQRVISARMLDTDADVFNRRDANNSNEVSNSAKTPAQRKS